MKYLYWWAWCIGMLLPSLSWGQTTRVLDLSTLSPIADVMVFHQTNAVFTNSKGEFDLSKITGADTLIFQHPSFKTKSVAVSEIKRNNYTVKLTEKLVTLEEYVVSVNRWEQDRKELPRKITSISPREVVLQNPQTSADLLGLSGQVFIQKSQMGGGSPMIRGMSANRVLLVVDGVRMNNAIFRSGNLQNVIALDANVIEHSEVIFGPGSVVYGSDALGGVMDFHTLTPKMATGDKWSVQGSSLLRYASANQEQTEHINLSLAKGKWSVLGSFTQSDFKDLRMGNTGRSEYQRTEYVQRINGRDSIVQNSDPNVQRFTAYSQTNWMQKVRFRPNKYWDLRLSNHLSSSSDVPRYDRLTQYRNDSLRFGEWFYGPQRWSMQSFQARYTKASTLFDQARLVVARQDYEESRHSRTRNSNRRNSRTENVLAYALNLDFDKKLNEQLALFYGAEGILNQVNSTAFSHNIIDNSTAPIASRYPDGSTWNSFAGYINVQYKPKTRLTLLGGLRYNQITTEADFDTTFFPFPFTSFDLSNQALNGSIGLVYRPNSEWQLQANVSSGFRAPNIDDLGKVFDSEPGQVVVPNPTLTPEYAYSIDAGVIRTVKDWLQVEGSFFYTLLDRAMVRRDFLFNGQDSIIYDGELSKVEALVNTEQQTIYGFQLDLSTELHTNLRLRVHHNMMWGESNDGQPVRHVTPTFGAAHIIYSYNRLIANAYINYNGSLSFDQLSLSERDKPNLYATDNEGRPFSPSWQTINFKLSYQWNNMLGLQAGVENIANLRYRTYSSGIVAPGRNFIVAIRTRF